MHSLRYVGAGIAFSAIGTVGTGIGILFNGLLQSMAINPVMTPRVFSYGLLGFALVESAILFSLLGGLFILFVWFTLRRALFCGIDTVGTVIGNLFNGALISTTNGMAEGDRQALIQECKDLFTFEDFLDMCPEGILPTAPTYGRYNYMMECYVNMHNAGGQNRYLIEYDNLAGFCYHSRYKQLNGIKIYDVTDIPFLDNNKIAYIDNVEE